MKTGSRTIVGLTIALIVLGCLAVTYLLDPAVFSFVSPNGGNPQNNIQPSQPVTVSRTNTVIRVGVEVITTVTASFCNCTDTDSQG